MKRAKLAAGMLIASMPLLATGAIAATRTAGPPTPEITGRCATLLTAADRAECVQTEALNREAEAKALPPPAPPPAPTVYEKSTTTTESYAGRPTETKTQTERTIVGPEGSVRETTTTDKK